MIPSSLDSYISSVLWENSTTPSMMDESSIFLFISRITGNHTLSYEEIIEANISNITIYDIPEDKKEFNVKTVRWCIMDIELKPYQWKNIYILRHFSTATVEAQNALLKILEECPEYAVIILEVENPNSMLETIRSRVINLTNISRWTYIESIGKEIITYYNKNDHKKLAEVLYNIKCSSNEAIWILHWVYSWLSSDDMIRCDAAIEYLSSTHENPRSILEIFFL